MKRLLSSGVCLAAVLCCASGARADGILIAGTDTEEFNYFGGPIVDHLAKTPVTGAAAGATAIITTNYFINGIGDKGGGVLYGGDPGTNAFRTLDYDGNLLTSGVGGYPNSFYNEDIAYDPGTNIVYRGHYPDSITAVDGTTGAFIASYSQTDVVGMAHVNGVIWISKWGGREVGTWDPLTNTYTKKFDTDGVGGVNGNAGGLAYDPFSDILWIGFSGGIVAPWSLTGTRLGAGYLPFGSIPDTVDGLVFLGESNVVPEPISAVLLGLGLAAVGLASRRRRSQ
jgi:hypothetical protein